jgi:hypothetical protein
VNASKEDARKAIRVLGEIMEELQTPENLLRAGLLTEFLEKCEKRLPSEASLARDKQRKVKK